VELKLAITAADATGRVWLQKEYAGAADTRAYKDVVSKPKDPFENVYNTLANDLLAARNALTSAQRVQIREVSDLRFRRRTSRRTRSRTTSRRIARVSTRSRGCPRRAIPCSRAWNTCGSATIRSSTP
jgi:hypothetical protein